MSYLIIYLAVGVLLALLERKSDPWENGVFWDYFVMVFGWLPMAVMVLFEKEED